MLFLGVLLTDAAFEYDEPIPDTCGSCTRCLETCPTGALIAPRVLDASRCISHATVESRADRVPGVSDGALNGWLYGCDDCQDACPWNGAARQEADERFLPRGGETDLDLAAVLAMDGDDFHRRFADSPILRAKLERLQRNARWLIEHGTTKPSPQAETASWNTGM
jgi:epoxyqueuosine reductase